MKVVNEDCSDWDSHVQAILLSYRVSRQKSTKYTPFELVYGVKARLPVDLDLPTASLPVAKDVDAKGRIDELKRIAEDRRFRQFTLRNMSNLHTQIVRWSAAILIARP